ncbi:hypothetical protein BaRGS_00031038, partial [Batillaria attramentaria]
MTDHSLLFTTAIPRQQLSMLTTFPYTKALSIAAHAGWNLLLSPRSVTLRAASCIRATGFDRMASKSLRHMQTRHQPDHRPSSKRFIS